MNQEHLAILLRGVKVWNKWREDCPDIRPDLSWGDFRGLIFQFANFSNVNLRGADLRGTDFSVSDLSGADFSNANLSRADLWECQCHQTDFQSAELFKTDITMAELAKARHLTEDQVEIARWEKGYEPKLPEELLGIDWLSAKLAQK